MKNHEGMRRALGYVAQHGTVKFRVDHPQRFRVGGPFHVNLLLDLVADRVVVAYVTGRTVVAAHAGAAYAASRQIASA